MREPLDENAGNETDAGGCVYGDNTCCVTDSIDGGSANDVEGNNERGAGGRFLSSSATFLATFALTPDSGPAHAVYFSTYEVVKQHLGGNLGQGHHPVATGTFLKSPCEFELKMSNLATAGACAAITSEACMNPFDGTVSYHSSGQVAN